MATMMKLSLMKRVFETVDSDWSCGLANQLVSRWPHDPGSVKMLRASANFVCVYNDGSDKRILRFNGAGERSVGGIETELRFIKDLAGSGIKAALPIESVHGRLVESFETRWGVFHASAFQRIRGEIFDIERLSADQFQKWGSALGELHSATRRLLKSSRYNRLSLDDLLETARAQLCADGFLKEIYDKILKWIDRLPRNNETYGLIHYDFELDNLIWNDGGISIIDFDDSVLSWYVTDIAHTLRDLFPRGDFTDCERYRGFLDGYRERCDIDQGLLNELPRFFRLHAFITLARVRRSVDIGRSPDNPPWMNDLIKKLEDLSDGYREMLSDTTVWER
jgi:Ser/Thr protein kinase RdoA (MazF antagonist)